MHRPHARACFSKGWDVLCEKPLAAEVDDAEALVSDAHAAGRILIAGHYKRFFPVFRQIRELIHGGQLGQLRSIRIREGGKFGWPAATASFFDPSQTPGGVLLDIGVHVLDILHWWLGTPESFDYEDDAMGGLEANCRLRGQFRGGATLDLFLSRDWATEDAWTLRFERGCAVYRVNQANRLRLTVEGLSRAMEATLQEGIQEADTNALSFSAQTAEALRCVASRAAPSVPGPEGLHALRWIRECYERRRLMTPPWFTPGEAARAESLAAGKGGMPR
jgi:predicted dehydrogenase